MINKEKDHNQRDQCKLEFNRPFADDTHKLCHRHRLLSRWWWGRPLAMLTMITLKREFIKGGNKRRSYKKVVC